MSAVDPTTGQPLPANAIQRVLFIGPKVHVYQIPPLTSTKGYTAATWTEDPKRHIFSARLRVLETGIDREDDDEEAASAEDVKVDVILEDPSNGQLFAAAPYTEPGVVEPALDSSRFFAVRVQDGQGRRAVLGIGFEERPDAFDFGVALQEARKTVRGFAEPAGATAARPSATASAQGAAAGAASAAAADKKDYSLKDGETITINLGGSSKFGRRSETTSSALSSSSASGGLGGFSLPPPPSSSSSSSSPFSLPPPPPPNRRTANRRSVGDPSVLGLASRPQPDEQKKSAAELGFDDGQFGEFA
ncbi:hypothetical protein HMPREF1624_03174 [Sporothrix schenckii ATCC 58251]|uniref:NECAP PHear domain-containing protein n=1 Tax=Sporothrix schenckii (strain ATCC 58251 / de Perez 2211183) TaxID=1391915 RepID=U7PYJ6_SPOS1|nr:hypothetical protein HMPREF1624_03174 [Sporothrix schenckii ATCC 58251]